jgi:tetratricopeptide (TPR) repeat protein
MKRLFIIAVQVVTAVTLVQAQRIESSVPSRPTVSPGVSVQTGNQPTKEGTPAAPKAPPQMSQSGKPMPQAKTQEEFKAYQEAAAKATPAEGEAAADAFATQYPDSDLKLLLYRKAMFNYQSANNGDKALAMCKKVLALDTDNPEALVLAAVITAQSTRETDLDRDERLNLASANASKALQTIDTDMLVPANLPPERVQAAKRSLLSMAYDALGTVAMLKKDDSTAEANFRKSAELNPLPDPVTWLRLSIALDHQGKYAQALDAANKAVQYSADAPQANNLAKMERDRLQKLASPGGTPAPAASPAPNSPAPATPPASKPPQ